MPVRGSTHALRLHPGKAQIAGAPADDVNDDNEEEDEEELLPPCPPAQAAIEQQDETARDGSKVGLRLIKTTRTGDRLIGWSVRDPRS